MAIPAKKASSDIFIILPLVALAVDLLTPFLIWKNVLPAEIRWLSHLAIAIMMMLTVIQIFSINYIPRAFWAVLAFSIVWSYVAVGHGQGIPSTLWGIWLLFQFPFVCLFAYLHPDPSMQRLGNIRKYALILLGVEVAVQLLQYAFGEQPGDDLAGLFGRNGTAIALLFAILVNCLFLGYWIVSKKWAGLIATLGLSLISGVLGELKIFPYVMAAAGLAAALIYALKYHSLRSFGKILLLIAAAILSFAFLYNSIVPAATRVPFQAYLEDPARLYEYLDFSESGYTSEGARFSNIGRMQAIEIGLHALEKDPITLLFGYGIGARSESRTLGTAGVGLSSGDFGWSTGTGLLVMMQETGMVGLLILGYLILWIILALVRDIHAMPDSQINSIRYALMVFSILWPILLWYTHIWTMRVPMLAYWYLLGYVLAESRVLKRNAPERVAELSLQGV